MLTLCASPSCAGFCATNYEATSVSVISVPLYASLPGGNVRPFRLGARVLRFLQRTHGSSVSTSRLERVQLIEIDPFPASIAKGLCTRTATSQRNDCLKHPGWFLSDRSTTKFITVIAIITRPVFFLWSLNPQTQVTSLR